LPTETELMARYSASRQTVREALRILMDQGLIVRRAGLGSVVIAAEPPVLFTHSVKSLGECCANSTRPICDVVGTANSSPTASRGAAEMRAGRAVPDRSGPPSDQSPLPGLDRDLCLAQIRGVGERSRPRPRAGHEQIAKNVRPDHRNSPNGDLVRGMPAGSRKALGVKSGSPALTVVRRYYPARGIVRKSRSPRIRKGATPTPWTCSARLRSRL